MSYEELGDASNMDAHLHLDCLKLYSQVNAITSPCPSHLEACRRLAINPLDPITRLLPRHETLPIA